MNKQENQKSSRPIERSTTTENARETARHVRDMMLSIPSHMPKLTAKALIQFPNIPSNTWSLGNRVLMQLGGQTDDARGIKQWNAVGRRVNKGAKAVYILGPRYITVTKKDEETGEETKRQVLIGFKSIPVYRKEDTHGESIDYEPKVTPPLANLAHIEYQDIAAKYNIAAYGAYCKETDKILLATEEIKTFFHELVHKYDFKTHDPKPGQDADQEIVAEFGAAVLAEIYGIECGRDDVARSVAYIKMYTKTESKAQVGVETLRLIDRVGKAISLILEDAAKVA